jgi:long-chain acyl-CoA synthetase
LAKGIWNLNLCPQVQGEEGGKHMRFTGIWSKNREEWNVTEFASMYLNSTIVGFYDSMGDSAVEFILNQTELTTIFCSAAYL